MSFKIYTKTGDKGETSIIGGKRLRKSDIRIDAYGTVDELNAHVGLVADTIPDSSQQELLRSVQSLLFTIGSNLAIDPDSEQSFPTDKILQEDIVRLEKAIDQMDESLPALKNFILPGGHPVVSNCHLARTVCRRAERMVVALSQASTVEEIIIQYLNRLSDYLFVLARKTSQDMQVEEVTWSPRKP